MLRVALTGGIATGKSHCLHEFARLGAPVADTDEIARDVVAPGAPGLDAVVGRFGPGVLDLSGAIDRAALARIVFSDAAARRDLEGIVHPLVYEHLRAWFAALEAAPGPDGVAIADIPLLYETGREGEFDRVIVASCPRELQTARLHERGLSAEEAARRLDAQRPIEDKARRADHVIDTSGTTEETDRQVRGIWELLSNRQSGIGNR